MSARSIRRSPTRRRPASGREFQYHRLAATALARLGYSLWVRGIGLTIVGAAWALTVSPALLGHVHWDIVPLFGGGIGAAIASFIRLPGYRELDLTDKQQIGCAVRAARRTGDERLDDMARDLLREGARSQTANRIMVPILMVAVLALPVVAAARVDERFLIALVPIAPVLTLMVVALTREPARTRLERFDRADQKDSEFPVAPSNTL